MSETKPVKEGQVLTGPLFAEPVRVETVRENGPETWTVGAARLQEPSVLGNLLPADVPPAASLPEATAWLNQNALTPFLKEVRAERVEEIDRISHHIEPSLTELIQKTDQEIGKANIEVEQRAQGAEGRLKMAEDRHAELMNRREQRRQALLRQRSLTLQAVERIASGQPRLIEIKGIGEPTGTVILTPNERRVAEDRRDCYWLYVVTNCNTAPALRNPIKDPERF
ncbi:MAG TPA: DUF3883 domain-containing protein [bacterium]|nr:DUF3883 domain-containing protein [bacterium]